MVPTCVRFLRAGLALLNCMMDQATRASLDIAGDAADAVKGSGGFVDQLRALHEGSREAELDCCGVIAARHSPPAFPRAWPCANRDHAQRERAER